MGSSYSNSYTNTKERSQPYQTYYHVIEGIIEDDKAKGSYVNGSYLKNPTAKNIYELINGEYIGDKNFSSDSLTYVIDENDKIIVGKRNGNGRDGIPTPHPSLIGGPDPKVKMAGILQVENGKIVGYDDRSGHYRPNKKSLEIAEEIFNKLPKHLFKNRRK